MNNTAKYARNNATPIVIIRAALFHIVIIIKHCNFNGNSFSNTNSSLKPFQNWTNLLVRKSLLNLVKLVIMCFTYSRIYFYSIIDL